MQTVRATAGR